MDALPAPFDLPYVQRGMAEMLLLSVGAGILGCWIVLRGLAFYSHAVGSAAFPGLVLADGLGFAAPLGALGAATAFALLVVALAGRERLGPDATTAVGLAGMLALGVILASDVFKTGVGVETLLFGSLLLVEPRDLVLAGVASAGALAATLTLGRAVARDRLRPRRRRCAGCAGAAVRRGAVALMALVVVAALSALGALLVAALVVVPAATVARCLRSGRCSSPRWSSCRRRPCASGPTAWRHGRRSPSPSWRPRGSPDSRCRWS